MKLFDTHCHLDLPELAADLQQHLQDAAAAGIARMLLPAVEAARWPLVLALQAGTRQKATLADSEKSGAPAKTAQPCTEPFMPHTEPVPHTTLALLHTTAALPEIEVALGIHPWWSETASRAQLDQLAGLLRDKGGQICAVGEIGLDFALDWYPSPEALKKHQLALLRDQLALARQAGKPVVLHHRKSQPELLQALKAEMFSGGGVLHAFSGSVAQAHHFLDLGFKLGIGGTISYERAQKTRDTVRKLPLDALVLETDAPAMPLAGFQGEINRPAQLRRVFEHLQSLRPEAPALLADALWQNSLQALGLAGH